MLVPRTTATSAWLSDATTRRANNATSCEREKVNYPDEVFESRHDPIDAFSLRAEVRPAGFVRVRWLAPVIRQLEKWALLSDALILEAGI